MVTSNYAPNATVECAFNAGYNTPIASWTWTDVSDYVEFEEGITINVGRSDERSTADANHLSLVLDNRDRRFTPGYTGGPYGSNVKLGRPIRVKATPVDGAQSTRFLGFIDELTLGWTTGTDAYAAVKVSASSRLSRLGLVAGLNNIVSQVILSDGPVAYYTMGEPSGSLQANDSSGSHANPLTSPDVTRAPTFGTAIGPGTDGLTAAQFGSENYMYASGVLTPAGNLGAIGFWLLVDVVPAAEQFVLGLMDASGGGGATFTVNTSGQLRVKSSDGGSTFGGTSSSIVDGNGHWVELVATGTSVIFYVDGVNILAFASTTFLGTQPLDLWIGPAARSGVGDPAVTTTVAHVAVSATLLSSTQVGTRVTVTSTGFAGETTSDRIARYLGYAGVETAALNAETGQVTVQHVDTTSKQVVELLRLMETTEGGVLYDHRDGTTTFQNRAHRLTLASSYTLDMAQQMVESDYSPKLDRSALFNDVSAQDVSGRFTAHVFDATSKTDNGVANLSIETAAEDDDEPLMQAGWALYKYKTPLSRVATLSVDALAQVGKTPNCFTVMATNVGDKITVSNQPSQAAASTATYFVEGWTETYGLESLRFTFNVSPSSPDDTTFVLGDATRGVLGTNPLAL